MAGTLATMLRWTVLAGMLAGAALTGCSGSRGSAGSSLLEATARERGWAPLPERLPQRAQFLRGVRICLDPGHGGDVGPEFDNSGFKRGPTGMREAEANLRTALKLRDLLREAGAEVLLTRSDDSDVSLSERCHTANQWRADLFLSIHHNAAASPAANYSSMWYHGAGTRNPASVDAARFLSDSIERVIALPAAKANGIYSDMLLYRTGLAVLRASEVPAVLAECSFFTNPAEENRLRIPEYNERMAWGLFLGLVDWAANGLPRWRPVLADESQVVVELRDGMKEDWGAKELRLRPGSIVVLLDGDLLEDWSLEGSFLSVMLPKDADPEAWFEVHFENRAKNSSVTGGMLLGNLWDEEMEESEVFFAARFAGGR